MEEEEEVAHSIQAQAQVVQVVAVQGLAGPRPVPKEQPER